MDDARDPHDLVADALLLVLLGDNQELSLEHPLEVVVPTPAGWLGIAAGSAHLLMPTAASDELLVSVCFGDDSEVMFLALARGDGALSIQRYSPGPWCDALTDLAETVRTPPVGALAPSSVALH